MPTGKMFFSAPLLALHLIAPFIIRFLSSSRCPLDRLLPLICSVHVRLSILCVARSIFLSLCATYVVFTMSACPPHLHTHPKPQPPHAIHSSALESHAGINPPALLMPFPSRTLQVVLVGSLLLLLPPPPLVLLLLLLLLLLFFWQFKEKIKRNCRQTPEAKLAESSSLQAACVCARCSM